MNQRIKDTKVRYPDALYLSIANDTKDNGTLLESQTSPKPFAKHWLSNVFVVRVCFWKNILTQAYQPRLVNPHFNFTFSI